MEEEYNDEIAPVEEIAESTICEENINEETIEGDSNE